jgi:molybdopterin-containing oxidoreductase family membrane subunit
MKGNKLVVGVFPFLDDTLKAIEQAKSLGLEYRVYSPFASHEIEEATLPARSPVGLFTLAGALSGLVGGFGLAIATSLDWPLRVSAKDIVSIPGFVVIGFECTILLGALFTFAAIFHFCRLPDIFPKLGYHPRFSDDRFGVVVGCNKDQLEDLKKLMTEAGAEEVEVRNGI